MQHSLAIKHKASRRIDNLAKAAERRRRLARQAAQRQVRAPPLATRTRLAAHIAQSQIRPRPRPRRRRRHLGHQQTRVQLLIVLHRRRWRAGRQRRNARILTELGLQSRRQLGRSHLARTCIDARKATSRNTGLARRIRPAGVGGSRILAHQPPRGHSATSGVGDAGSGHVA